MYSLFHIVAYLALEMSTFPTTTVILVIIIIDTYKSQLYLLDNI